MPDPCNAGTNRLLGAIPAPDRKRPALNLELVEVELKQVLFDRGKRIDSVYFPGTAVVSILTTMDDGTGVEIATVGVRAWWACPCSWGRTSCPSATLDDYVCGAPLRAGAAGFLLKSASPPRSWWREHAPWRAAATCSTSEWQAGHGQVRPAVPRAKGDCCALVAHRTGEDELALFVGGPRSTELAARLDVSEATAKTHVSHVLTELGVRDRLLTLVYAYESGFVDGRGPARVTAPGAVWELRPIGVRSAGGDRSIAQLLPLCAQWRRSSLQSSRRSGAN